MCELLHDAARDLGITWTAPDDERGDTTGYFHDRDLATLEGEMLHWLRCVARWSMENPDHGDVHLAMPMEYQYRLPGVKTSIGLRDRDWLRAVVEDPTRGIDFFPWWTPGDNAAALLGRARCLMWTEVRWRAPTFDAEEELRDEVVDVLRRAWALDPALDCPAREWCQLDDDPPAAIAARAAVATGPLLGYRRHPLRVTLHDRWSVEIPGELSEEWEDTTWSAWHLGRTVWFTSYRREARADEMVESAPVDGEVLRRRDGAVVKKGYLARGADGFTLSTRNAIDGKLAVSTIVYPDEDARAWAMEVWASITCAG